VHLGGLPEVLEADHFVVVVTKPAREAWRNEMGSAREGSRTEWNWEKNNTVEVINAGSLQRIADACELMAKNHAELIRERDNYERWYRQEQRYKEQAQRSAASLRGQITKLKRQLAALQKTEEATQ
jgi:thiamine kinase-like enzyme